MLMFLNLKLCPLFCCDVVPTGGEDRFEVDPHSGVVRTRKNIPFKYAREYEIGKRHTF